MAVGLGLEAKKLRWLWKGGDRSQSAALLHPTLYPSASQPTQGQDLPLAKCTGYPGCWWSGCKPAPLSFLPAPLSFLPTPPILSHQEGLQGAFAAPPCASPTHLSRWSFWARVRQSAPRLQGGSRLVMIFCRMRKGILKALGPTRAGTPPFTLQSQQLSKSCVLEVGGGVEVPVRTFMAQAHCHHLLGEHPNHHSMGVAWVLFLGHPWYARALLTRV